VRFGSIGVDVFAGDSPGCVLGMERLPAGLVSSSRSSDVVVMLLAHGVHNRHRPNAADVSRQSRRQVGGRPDALHGLFEA
jgi:hypothetical protein